MSYIENIYICMMAPMLLSILLLPREGKRPLIFILSGMTACLLSSYISTFAINALNIGTVTASYEITPVVEEVVKFLPVLFYLLIFGSAKQNVIRSILLVSVGFATFENVCFLTVYGTSELMQLVIRGFGTGAIHVVCGMVLAVGLFFLWDINWLRIVGTFALLCFAITCHAIFNILVNQSGIIFWIGSSLPLIIIIIYMVFLRTKVRMP